MLPAVGAGVAIAAVVALIAWILMRRGANPKQDNLRLDEAKETFHRRREWLEAKFVTLASKISKPRGLEWKDCEFEDEFTFARDRKSGRLSAFVGVTISFRAVEGGGMEDVEAVGNLRAGTAVFYFDDDGEWFTEGRAIFNLNPHQAIEHFRHELEFVNEA